LILRINAMSDEKQYEEPILPPENELQPMMTPDAGFTPVVEYQPITASDIHEVDMPIETETSLRQPG
jgi:hypothetical protein